MDDFCLPFGHASTRSYIHTSMTATSIHQHLDALGDPEKAAHAQRFFKTGPGQYGEGDIFVGIRVPVLRRLAKEYQALSLAETTALLHSPIHEARLLALLILVRKYAKGDAATRKTIYDLYLKNTRWINNWDLVDVTTPHIVGKFLMDRSREPLYRLARSSSLWERRIAIITTFEFIRHDQFEDTLAIAETLLHDKEDLIHKAVGWMLREVGKRNLDAEEGFLHQHYRTMPRTMLRYAIEKFPEPKRQAYLKGEV